MDTRSGRGRERSSELKWDQAALARVFGYLDAASLVNVQLANKTFRDIVKNDSVWECVLVYAGVCDCPCTTSSYALVIRLCRRSSFRNDFSYYADRIMRRNTKRVAWHSEYVERAHREYCWRTGKLSKDAVVLTGHAGTVYAATFLDTPFRPGTIVTGAYLDTSSRGEIKMWLPSRGTTASNAVANLLEDRSTCVQVDTKEEVTKSGILSLYQLYGTPQVACTTFESGVHIVRAREVVHEVPMDERASSVGEKREREEGDGDDCLQRSYTVKDEENPGGSAYSFYPVLECLGQEAPCAKTFVDKNSRILAIPSLDGAVRLYSLPKWITNCSLNVDENDSMEGADQGKEPTLSPSAELYDDVELLVTENNVTSRVTRQPVCALTMSETCDVMVTGGNDMRVKVWDMHHNVITSRMEGHAGWIWNVKPLDPFLNVAMSTSTDGFCRKWDRRTGKSVGQINVSAHGPGNIYPVTGVALRGNGWNMAVGSMDKSVYVLDCRMMKRLYTIGQHEDRVCRAMMHEDTLMTTGWDHSVRLWEFA